MNLKEIFVLKIWMDVSLSFPKGAWFRLEHSSGKCSQDGAGNSCFLSVGRRSCFSCKPTSTLGVSTYAIRFLLVSPAGTAGKCTVHWEENSTAQMIVNISFLCVY